MDQLGAVGGGIGAPAQPELGVGEYNVLDSVLTDPADRIVDCD
jgi:hypothetical protein